MAERRDRRAHSAPGVLDIVARAQRDPRPRGTGGGREGADIGGQTLQNGRRRLGAVELLGDQAMDEGLQRRTGGILRDPQRRLGAAQIGDGPRIVDAVVAVRREQRRGDVGRSRGAGQAREEEVRVAAPALVAALAGDPGPRGLAAQRQGRAESRPAKLDQIGLLRIARRRQALGEGGAERRDRIGAGRQPARRMQPLEPRRARAAQGKGAGDSDQDAGGPFSIHRRRSSLSAQPKLQTVSSLASMRRAPARSPRSTISSP